MSLGNENNPLKARMQGVRTARDGTGQGTGQALTVTNITEAKAVFVGYNDERGSPCVALYFQVGDQFYAPSDTVAWCANLRPMTDWLKQQVASGMKDREPAKIPKEDAVDVLGDHTGAPDQDPPA